jgi:mxaJ protein
VRRQSQHRAHLSPSNCGNRVRQPAAHRFAPPGCVLRAVMVFAAATQLTPIYAAVPARVLLVCADPNNLPFSSRAGEGFENKLVALLAHDMDARVKYVWWAQRRGYVRRTLNEAKCDIWPGVATGVDNVTTTRPYYRSTYVFVTRSDKALKGLTLDDARLKSLSIGVQMIGDNATNTPPAHALAARGLIDNVRGYMLFGDYQQPNPSATIIDAVARGDIDVALVWGPLAGFFAHRSEVPLRLEPVTAQTGIEQWPMVYDISVGIRPGSSSLRTHIEAILDRERPAIVALLRAYHVPQAQAPGFDPAGHITSATGVR